MSKLTEVVKNFFKAPEPPKNDSSVVNPENVVNDLTNSDYWNTGIFFDSTDQWNNSSLFNRTEIIDILVKQREKIRKYRQLSMTPDVTDAIDEIVNEIIFSYDDELPVKIDINEENEKLVKAIDEKFKKIVKLMNLKRTIFNIVKTGYIDGQLVVHTVYDSKNTKKGIKSIKLIDPCMLYYDAKESAYRYMDDDRLSPTINKDELYSIEEICIEDFGLKDGKINLGYLEYALKPANMLRTLEDLLIPLRFSRSISRRVFNVDIGDLPVKRGTEVMNEHQQKFKYKKFYNNETGEISNQQHILSMVEDYWFANRSGGKGTTVDVLDESGNLGELDDILYFSRKLYRAMKIPSNRIDINPDGDRDFEYDSTRVTKEDMKFFMFISRIRQVYSSLFKEILKREVVSTGTMTESEWEDKEELIKIVFINENKFIENMKLANFTSKLEIYATAQEYQGKLFSVQKILTEIFRYSEDEIQEEFKAIQKEEKDPLFAKFYKSDEDEF